MKLGFTLWATPGKLKLLSYSSREAGYGSCFPRQMAAVYLGDSSYATDLSRHCLRLCPFCPRELPAAGGASAVPGLSVGLASSIGICGAATVFCLDVSRPCPQPSGEDSEQGAGNYLPAYGDPSAESAAPAAGAHSFCPAPRGWASVAATGAGATTPGLSSSSTSLHRSGECGIIVLPYAERGG